MALFACESLLVASCVCAIDCLMVWCVCVCVLLYLCDCLVVCCFVRVCECVFDYLV